MTGRNRREFLTEVGRGALTAGLGVGLAADLGLAPARAEAPDDRLTFGPMEPLVGLMQDTPPDKLQPLLIAKLQDDTKLRELTAAAALANARTFGGEDYTGYHTLMALAPAFQMAGEMPADKAPLPVLKVIYRNASRIQERGVGQRQHALRARRGHRPHDAVPVAFGKQRHGTVRGEALEGPSLMRSSGLHFGRDGDLPVIGSIAANTVDARAAPIGNHRKSRGDAIFVNVFQRDGRVRRRATDAFRRGVETDGDAGDR